MARDERSLRLELACPHATTDEERARILTPPGPTPTAPMPLLLGTAAVLAGEAVTAYVLSRLARPAHCAERVTG